MRVTVSHNKPKEEVIRAVDRSFDDLFRGTANLPLQLVNQQNNWNRDTLTFSCTAKMGFLSTPISGTVYVTDKDVTIDADLGFLEKMLSATRARASIENRVRGLLK
jgi:hypothetical protein